MLFANISNEKLILVHFNALEWIVIQKQKRKEKQQQQQQQTKFQKNN